MSFICRNIKLENTFLDQNGHCKLCDFGLSRRRIFYGMNMRTFIGAVPYTTPEVIITIYFTCDSCIFCRVVLHFYWCYCEFFILYKFIIIFIENVEVLRSTNFLFCPNVFVGCSKVEVWTWSWLVVAWHHHVYNDGGTHAFWGTYDLFLWSSSQIATVSNIPDQKCCFHSEWGEYN